MESNVTMVQVNIRMPELQFNHLKRLARKESLLRDEDITLADLLRAAASETYPMEGEVGSDKSQRDPMDQY